MAKMFGTPDRSDPKSEHQLFESLSRLPDSWRVFYSVAWQAPRGKYMSDGETDFVLLHKDLGLYIVEVKGGEIRRGFHLEHNKCLGLLRDQGSVPNRRRWGNMRFVTMSPQSRIRG